MLDASAILAVLFEEPGADLADEQCPHSVVSVVNAVEVEEKLLSRSFPVEQLDPLWTSLGVRIVGLDASTGRRAAALLSRHRRAGLSLGDAVCLATAAELSLPVLTADRMWADLGDVDTEVCLVR